MGYAMPRATKAVRRTASTALTSMGRSGATPLSCTTVQRGSAVSSGHIASISGPQHPCHLEAADAELLRDLDLGLVLQVEQPGHGCRLHQLLRTRAVGADARPRILPGAHRCSPTPIEEAVSTEHACPDPLAALR